MLWVLFTIVSTIIFVTIRYWRDIQFDPTVFDLFIYLMLVPFGVGLIVFSPYFIFRGVKKFSSICLTRVQQISEPKSNIHQDETVGLAIYAVNVCSVFGENEQLISAMQHAQGPKLDTQLFDSLLRPCLSFRMNSIDEDGNKEKRPIIPIHQRLEYLLLQELQRYTIELTIIANQFRQAVFERINIHLIVSEEIKVILDEEKSNHIYEPFFDRLGFLPHQIKYTYHYLSPSTIETQWLSCLMQVSKQTTEVSLFIVMDSEISQQFIDEKTRFFSNYIAAEYAASCLLTSSKIKIHGLDEIENIYINRHKKPLVNILKKFELTYSEQYNLDCPFIIILDDPADNRAIKIQQKCFANTAIETQHLLNVHKCLGSSQNLSLIFGFILAMKIHNCKYRVVYHSGPLKTPIFISSINEYDILD